MIRLSPEYDKTVVKGGGFQILGQPLSEPGIVSFSLLGSVDILGRLFRFQQERNACRPDRDVSRLTVEVDKII